MGHFAPMSEPRKPVSRKDRVQIAKWLESQRGRPQFRPAPHAARAAARVMRPLSKKFSGGSTVASLLPHWSKIVGPRFAKLSSPEKFTAGKGKQSGRTLIIHAPGAAAALITAGSGPIIQRLNNYLGPDYVSHIKVVQRRMHTAGALPTFVPQKRLTTRQENRLQSGLEKLDRNDLKQALEGLGRRVLSRNSDTAGG